MPGNKREKRECDFLKLKQRVDMLEKLIRKHFELTPKGIIKALDLRKPRFLKTAGYGHFGRSEEEFTWEKTDKASSLAKEGLAATTAA